MLGLKPRGRLTSLRKNAVASSSFVIQLVTPKVPSWMIAHSFEEVLKAMRCQKACSLWQSSALSLTGPLGPLAKRYLREYAWSALPSDAIYLIVMRCCAPQSWDRMIYTPTFSFAKNQAGLYILSEGHDLCPRCLTTTWPKGGVLPPHFPWNDQPVYLGTGFYGKIGGPPPLTAWECSISHSVPYQTPVGIVNDTLSH